MFVTCTPARINGDVLTTLPTLYNMAEKFFLTNLFALLSPTGTKPGCQLSGDFVDDFALVVEEKANKKVLPFVPHQAHFASNFASSTAPLSPPSQGKKQFVM